MFLFCNHHGNRYQLKGKKKEFCGLWDMAWWLYFFSEYLSLSQIRRKKNLEQKLNYSPNLWSKEQRGLWSTFSLCLFNPGRLLLSYQCPESVWGSIEKYTPVSDRTPGHRTRLNPHHCTSHIHTSLYIPSALVYAWPLLLIYSNIMAF